MEALYDTSKYNILYANDMKVGPDGRIYVGTQSSKRYGVSDKIDGKLYSIDSSGEVRVLLDGLILSNGLEWSMDEKRFYHTDSDTHMIKERHGSHAVPFENYDQAVRFPTPEKLKNPLGSRKAPVRSSRSSQPVRL